MRPRYITVEISRRDDIFSPINFFDWGKSKTIRDHPSNPPCPVQFLSGLTSNLVRFNWARNEVLSLPRETSLFSCFSGAYFTGVSQ